MIDGPEPSATDGRPPTAMRRRALHVSADSLVAIAPLLPERPLPIVVRPALPGLDLNGWAEEHRGQITDLLLRHGAVLFRGFTVDGPAAFERFIRATSDGRLMDYVYRSTPRRRVAANVFTSTEYPPDQVIPLHNEMAYAATWPMKLWFYCAQPAAAGGETPIADSRAVFAAIPAAVRERWTAAGITYVRNYGGGLDLPWQEVFNTDSPAEVEAFCREAGIAFTWRDDGRLRTRQTCQAAAVHPVTGARVWFNQAHLFHPSALPEEARAALAATVSPDELPRTALLGDGSELPAADLALVRAAYAREQVVFPWRQNDILLIDNMLTAHGRLTFTPPRSTLVGMAEPSGDGPLVP